MAEAQITLVALARHIRDHGIDVNAARVLMDDTDPVLCTIVAARLLRNALTDLTHYAGCTLDELLDQITKVAVDQAAGGWSQA